MDVLCPAEARERDCDCNTRCDLPLQGSGADNCHTATAGFYDANKVVFVVECDDSIVVCACGQSEGEDQGGYSTSDGRQPASTPNHDRTNQSCSSVVHVRNARLDA
jgi:hypothetical protein